MANARVRWHGAAEAANREVETVAKVVADEGPRPCGVEDDAALGSEGVAGKQAAAGGRLWPRRQRRRVGVASVQKPRWWPCVGGNFFRLEFQFF